MKQLQADECSLCELPENKLRGMLCQRQASQTHTVSLRSCSSLLTFHLPELFYSALFSVSCYQSLSLFFGGIFGFILLEEVWEYVCSNKLEL